MMLKETMFILYITVYTLKNVIGSDHVVLHGFAASLHPLPQCLFSCIQGAGLAEAGSLSDEYVDH